MSIHLVIHDNDMPYWWESPDVWVVPGNDPNGPPGSPIVGQPAFLWARVTNLGDVAAKGTRVDFYWANPAGQMIVGVATSIGSAFVDLDANNDTQEVLCLVPWVPATSGHECVLAVAHVGGDTNPIPDPLPQGYPFDPPTHEQIAQRNLSVIAIGPHAQLLTVFVNAMGRTEKLSQMTIEFGDPVREHMLVQLGLHNIRPAKEKVVSVSLSREPRCGDQPDPKGSHELTVQVPRGTSVPIFVAIHAEHLPKREYQVVRIVERISGNVVGGVSYLVVNPQ
jgi:hypothetical protein